MNTISTASSEHCWLTTLRSTIRYAQAPDNHSLIPLWLANECCCPQAVIGPCYCSRDAKRVVYQRQFALLLDVVMDELLPVQWRCSCLDHIYRPLLNLQRLANDAHSMAQVKQLYYELAASTRYVQQSLEG